MKIGTKSVLFGAHAFWLHPWFVAWAWFKLYGWNQVYVGQQYYSLRDKNRNPAAQHPVMTSLWDPRLWIAFFLHDLGYWGKSDMDGEEGEWHPLWAANLVYKWFGTAWFWFVLLHSRFLAKNYGREPSNLCWADKLSMSVTPWWLYLPMVKMTGEIREYRHRQMAGERDNGAVTYSQVHDLTDKEWVLHMQQYCRVLAEDQIHAPA